MKWHRVVGQTFEFAAYGRILNYRVSMQHGDSWVATVWGPRGGLKSGDQFNAGESDKARWWCEDYERKHGRSLKRGLAGLGARRGKRVE